MVKNIEFKKKIKEKRISGMANYYICDFGIKIDGEDLNVDSEEIDHLEKLKDILYSQYLDTICGLFHHDYKTVVRLSGADNDIKKLLPEYFMYMGAIIHYHFWQTDLEVKYDEENFVILVCDKRHFKKLFKKYWFSIGKEQRFEVFILEKEQVIKLEKWSRRKEGNKKVMTIIDMSLLTIDNLENGFYFRISSNKKGNIFFESLLKNKIELI